MGLAAVSNACRRCKQSGGVDIWAVGHVQHRAELSDVAVVVVHGFGCGVFSWRAVQQPLADATGCLVLIFDRPGFGALCLSTCPSCP